MVRVLFPYIILRENDRQVYDCYGSLRRFTYGDLVTTSPSSRWEGSTKFPAPVGLPPLAPVLTLHQHTQSVGATGGVYKGQGRNQRELMTRAY